MISLSIGPREIRRKTSTGELLYAKEKERLSAPDDTAQPGTEQSM